MALPKAATQPTPSPPWWRDAVVYQIYPRSFADGNGDGIGDLAGLRSRLWYLRELGVDAMWINPWFPSPLNDGGYDVADYCDIDPTIGTLDEAEALIDDAHGQGLRVVIDLVPNHTSSEHAWFRHALASPPGDPARDLYIFRRGHGHVGELPPNDWQSLFGGPAWTQVADGEWYLHLFDATQPDLNWNNPRVRDEFTRILRFWLDRGIDGFRVDVAHGMAKDPDLPDLGGGPLRATGPGAYPHPYWDRDEVHDIIRGWRRIVDGYDDRMMIAEASVHSSRLTQFLGPDQYHQTFNFELLEADWSAPDFTHAVSTSIGVTAGTGSSPTWVLSNHDVLRDATRFGLPPGTGWRTWPADGDPRLLDAVLGAKRARAAALILLALPGSAYLYQGEELGLPDVIDLPDEVITDPMWERSGRTERGRDGCRVPLPWEPEGPSLGFGRGDAWLPQPPTFGPLAVSVQRGDERSMLTLCRSAIRARRLLLSGDLPFDPIDMGRDVFAFRRGSGFVCAANMGPEPVRLPAGRLHLASGTVDGRTLPPDTSVWLGR